MAFCKYCGSPLAEGQVCACPQAQEEAKAAGATPPPAPQQQTPPQYQQQPNYQYQPQQPPKQPGENPFNLIGEHIKAYFKAPVASCQTLVREKKMVPSLVMLAIQGVVYGLLFFFLLSKILSDGSGMMGSMVGVRMSSGQAPFFLCLIFGFLMSVMNNAANALVLFILVKIGKVECSYVDALTFWGGHSPLVVAIQLVSILMCLINLFAGVLFLLLGGVFSWILMVYSTESFVPNSGNKLSIIILTVVLTVVAALVVTWLSNTLFTQPIVEAIARSYYSW